MQNLNTFPIAFISLEELDKIYEQLNKKKQEAEIQVASVNDKVLSIRQACIFLNISESTLRRRMEKREIEFIQLGKWCKITFRKSHLQEYLDNNTRRSYSKAVNTKNALDYILKK